MGWSLPETRLAPHSPRRTLKEEAGPVKGDREAGLPPDRELRRPESLSRWTALVKEAAVEADHELRGGTIGNVPQAGQDPARSGGEEALDETAEPVAPGHPRLAGGVAGGQGHQLGREMEPREIAGPAEARPA